MILNSEIKFAYENYLLIYNYLILNKLFTQPQTPENKLSKLKKSVVQYQGWREN